MSVLELASLSSGYGKIPKRMVRDELEARGLLDLDKTKTG